MKKGIKNIVVSAGLMGLFISFTNYANAGYFSNTTLNVCGEAVTRDLGIGQENDEVMILQAALHSLGYLNTTPNGYFGPMTRSAVRAFQRDNGLSSTGRVGPMTREAINEHLCGSSDTSYLNTSGVTYVEPFDQFVKVISPSVTNPVIYENGINNSQSNFYGVTNYNQTINQPINNIIPSTTQIASTNVIYTSNNGYTYGLTPVPGSITVTSPIANTVYQEGDTVLLNWTTNNLNANTFQILLENTSSGQSKIVNTTSSFTSQFTLTKALLDSVCQGICDNNNNGSFRIVISTPVRDIAGTVSNFRAVISPVTIKRPYANYGTVSLTTNRNPVNSGEGFKLYVNIPTGASWNANVYGNYSFRIKAVCPSGVNATVAGVSCGQEFVLPFAPTYFQSEIPAVITNASYYPQTVKFEITVTTLSGQVIASGSTNINVNATPFSW